MKALITGASSGIGRSLAVKLDEKGYEIILVARNLGKLKDVKSNLKNKNSKIESIDISKVENCQKLFEKYPNIDLLVNNAGFGDCGDFEDTSLEKDISMINTNIISYHVLTKLYLKQMIKNDKGQILNVASIAGFMAGPLMATYYATKNYVVKLSEAIREELKVKKSNVKISILCPGPVNTNFNKIANVNFAINGLESDYVAKYTIKKLEKNKFYIIPGFTIKMSKICSKIFPVSLVSKFVYKIQKKKRKGR